MLTRIAAILLGLALTVVVQGEALQAPTVQALGAGEEDGAPNPPIALGVEAPAETDRDGKFWWPGVIYVSMWNTSCTTDSDFQGWCFKASECSFRGGTADGSCAEDQGVCCDLTDGGDTTISSSGSSFSNKGYPSPNARSGNTTATLEPPAGTVQVKLTFDEFNLTPPEDGDCNNDTFVFVGANPGVEVPVLCGYNTGQHMYIDVDNSEGPWELVATTTEAEFNRSFKVTVDFLTLNDANRAPFRCLQFFPDKEGEMMTFNYNTEMPENSMLLNNQMYSICFGYVSGYCDIGITAARLDIGEISGKCTDDYLSIGTTVLCGDLADYSLTVNATGPTVIKVASDDDNSDQQEGFMASYMMMECA